MPWFKVDDQLDGNKKVKSIPRRNRTKALGLWVMAGAFSARELTDGFVPDYMIEELASTPKVAAELVAVGMWERVENGYKFSHWSEFQPTSDEVRSKRQNDAERKRRWRESALSKKEKSSDQQVSQNVTLGQERPSARSHSGSHSGSPLYPTRPDPTYKEEKGKEESKQVTRDQTETPPSSFVPYGSLDDPRCARHRDLPKDQVPACRDCGKAREVWQQRADDAKAEKRRVIDECGWCDSRGIAELHDADGRPVAVKCGHTHPPQPPPPPESFKPLRTKKKPLW